MIDCICISIISISRWKYFRVRTQKEKYFLCHLQSEILVHLVRTKREVFSILLNKFRSIFGILLGLDEWIFIHLYMHNMKKYARYSRYSVFYNI